MVFFEITRLDVYNAKDNRIKTFLIQVVYSLKVRYKHRLTSGFVIHIRNILLSEGFCKKYVK